MYDIEAEQQRYFKTAFFNCYHLHLPDRFGALHSEETAYLPSGYSLLHGAQFTGFPFTGNKSV